MKKQNNIIKIITNAGMLAAVLVVARIFVITFLKSGTPIGKLLGAPKEMQFYIIPAATLFLINKFGKQIGFKMAFAGALIGVIVSGVLGKFSFYVNHYSLIFDYVVPWLLCTLIAFAPKNSKLKLAISMFIIWIGVMASWSISGVLAWGVKTYTAAFTWSLLTFNGWIMLFLLPIMVVALDSKLKKIK